MYGFWKRVLCLSLALVLAAGLLPFSALATDQTPTLSAPEEEYPVGGVIPDNMEGGTVLTDAYVSGKGSGLAEPKKASLPGYYDARNYGYITSVKNQNPFGTCWAHGTIASIESYMIKHGVVDGYTGYAAAGDVDLSELHLSWFAYTDAYDAKGMLTGDTTRVYLDDLAADEDHTYLNRGGNGQISTFTLMRWTGATSEHWVNYSNAGNVKYSGLDSSLAYQYDTVRVTDADWIPVANRNAVKNAIMEYGAGCISYNHQSEYLNSSTGGYCYIVPDGYNDINHVVTVVGWDDSYSRYNFNEISRPVSDGAWICKNSWGTGFGKDGYFYISYEDTAAKNNTSYFFKAAPWNNYNNNYQYDGTAYSGNLRFKQNCDVANVFTANSPELLKAVAICTKDENTSYTLKIYRNPNQGNPTSGTLMCTQSGVIPYWGYHTIPLNTDVPITTGDTFSVVFSLSTGTVDEDGYRVHVPVDMSSSNAKFSYTHVDRKNNSYYRTGSTWYDTPYEADFRIKAFTDNANYNVEAYYQPSNLGTVAFEDGDSYHLIATPNTCAYVSGAEIVSGEGRCWVDGNRITVAPYSDCKVKIIFSANHSFSNGACTRCGTMAPPQVTLDHVSSSGKVRLTWDSLAPAACYEVYRYDYTDEMYKLVETVYDSLHYVDSSGVAGETYYYAVRGMKSDGTAGEFSQVLKGTCRVTRPVVTATHGPDTGKPKLTWEKVSGAVKYTVYRSTSKTGTYTAVKTTTDTSFIDSNTTVGKTYYYRVKAVASVSDASSAKSPAQGLTRRLPRPTVTAGHNADTGKNKLTWKKVSGAEKYEVYRSTSKTGSYSLVKTTTNLSYTHTAGTAGKTYYYMVRAIASKSAANSAKTDAKGVVCDLPRPVVSITLSSGKPKLSWKAVTGAVKYQVYRSTSKSGTYTLKKTTTGKTWTDTAAVKGKIYYYKVVAVHTKSSANSAKSLVKYIYATR